MVLYSGAEELTTETDIYLNNGQKMKEKEFLKVERSPESFFKKLRQDPPMFPRP